MEHAIPVVVAVLVLFGLGGSWIAKRRGIDLRVVLVPRELRDMAPWQVLAAGLKEGGKALYLRWQTWAILMFLFVPLLISSGMLTMWVHEHFRDSANTRLVRALCLLILMLPATFPLVCLYIQMQRFIRVFLRQYLAERGYPLCAHCGYNLRGQLEHRCPECGAPFDVADSTAESDKRDDA